MAKVDKAVSESTEEDANVAMSEKARGRAGVLSKFQQANPDFQGDPSDDDLWGFAGQDYDEVKGKYKEMSGANAQLAELVSKDPKLGVFLSRLVGDNPSSVPKALGDVFGRDWLESMDDFEEGYQENMARLAESRAEQEQAAKNIEEFKANLEKFKSDNGLDDTQIDALREVIYEDAENFLMGNIPLEYIKYKWKGMNYDKDVEEAAITGEVEGRNQAIEVKKKTITGDNPVPDLGSGTGAGKNRLNRPTREKRSAYDGMTEV